MSKLARQGRTEVSTDAPPEVVWDIITDVTRIGEWSHECQGARWAGPSTGAAPGVRFRGTNRSGVFRWSRSCIFTVVNQPHELAWRTVGLMGKGDSTEWRIRLEPAGKGTKIVQTYDVVRINPGLDRLYWRLIKAHRDRREALAEDLQRLAKLAAEQTCQDHNPT